MSLKRWLAAGSLAAAALVAGMASAACGPAAVCTSADLPAGCCIGNTCTLDGTISLTGPTCDLNFGARNVTLTGTLNVGTQTLTIEAGSFRINGGLLDAHGTAGNPGGNLTITTTGGGSIGYALMLDGGGATGINLTGFGRGGGSLRVDADGPVTIAGGRIDASGAEATAGGGSIQIESTAGALTVGAPILADSQIAGFGGFVSLKSAADLTVTSSGTVSALGGSDSGSISLDAGGALLVSAAASVGANGLNGSANTGGDVSITGGSVRVEGTIEASGGGDATRDSGGDGGTIYIETRTGPLVLTRAAQGLTADGAGGADGGEIALVTDSPTNGDLRIETVVSAQGFGGLQGRSGGGGTVEVDAAANFVMVRSINVSGIGGATGLVDLSAQRDLTVNASIVGSDPAGGGSLTVASHHDVVFADVGSGHNVRMNATTNGSGGEIQASAGNDLRIVGFQFDVSAEGLHEGGQISADAGRNLSVDQNALLNANSQNAEGGHIDLTAGFPDLAGNLQIDGDLTAKGHAIAQALLPASVTLAGCQVTISNRGLVDSTGDLGTFNRIIARTAITVAGSVLAAQSNIAVYPSSGPVPAPTGPVSPAFTLAPAPVCTGAGIPAGCLMPCPECGNGGAFEFPEQCDPPGCGTNCDIHCRLLVPAGCDDGRSCTDDTCDATFGCVNEPMADGRSCNDGNPCTTNDTCRTGFCDGGPAPDCDDGNVCTRDSCVPASGGCIHPPVTCTADPNLCLTAPMCDAPGGCHPGPPMVCPPGEVCNPATGVCGPKMCPNGAADCNDGNPCTADTCSSPGALCNSAPISGVTAGCGDTNPCNGTETCTAGVCTPGAPPTCDDSNVCTVDTCDAVVGCRHTPIPGCCRDRTECPGFNDCTVCMTDNTCGSRPNCCVGDPDCEDSNVCTADSCNPGTHLCNHAAVAGDCGDACQPGTCQGGSCALGQRLTCPPDPDACHPYRCDPVAGCVNPFVEGCCRNDGDCADGNNCTDDVCTEGHQCTNNPKFLGCTPCTTDLDCDPLGACAGKQCGAGGVCVAVTPPECDNRRPSFRGLCVLDPAGAPSCQYQCLLNGACDDANACNGVETCSGGACHAGTAPDCDDHDGCTDDACDPATGCTHVARTGYAAARCVLDGMDAALNAAGLTDIAPSLRIRVAGLLGKVRAKLSAAESAGQGKRALKPLKAAGKQLKSIGKVVRAALHKRKIYPGLAQKLLDAVDGSGRAVDTLKTSITP